MSNVIYSCIFGARDNLHEPKCEIPPGVRLVLFTDDSRLRSEKWEIQHAEAHPENPRISARRIKLLSHVAFPDAESTLWIDGHLTLLNLNGIFERESQFALRRHPRRSCVYQEIRQCRRQKQDSYDLLNKLQKRYETECFPEQWGLWMTGILFRRHTPEVCEFNQRWWDELSANSIRDQISFPYLARKTGLEFETLPDGVPSFHWGNHRV